MKWPVLYPDLYRKNLLAISPDLYSCIGGNLTSCVMDLEDTRPIGIYTEKSGPSTIVGDDHLV